MPLQRFGPLAAALDSVVAQLQVQCGQLPACFAPAGLELQAGRLPAQASVHGQCHIGFELLVAQSALALQRAAQLAWQFRQPVGRIDIAQRQRGAPVDAIGEADAQVSRRPALSRLQFQLRQVHALQIPTDRAFQREITRRPAHGGIEMAQVVARIVLQLCRQGTQCHRRRFRLWIQAPPGKILPLQRRLALQGLAPVQMPCEADPLPFVGYQFRPVHARARLVDQPVQLQGHRPALARQAATGEQSITLVELALGGQHEAVQTQTVRQIGAGLEAVQGQFQRRGQPAGQGLQLAAQVAVQVAGAIDVQPKALAHIALHVELQRPGLLVDDLQRGIALQAQGPGAAGLQPTGQRQFHVGPAGTQLADVQPGTAPIGPQLQ